MDQQKILFPSRFDYKNTDSIVFAFDKILSSCGWNATEETDLTEFIPKLYREKLDLQIEFDMSGTQYIGLQELGSLLTFGRFCWMVTGHKVKCAFPKVSRVITNLLLPWNFFEFFYQWGIPTSPIPDQGEPWPPHNSLPFTRIKEFADVQRTARDLKKPRIERILRDTFGLDTAERNSLVDTIVSEICDNIPFHSASEGVIAVQLHVRRPSVTHLVGSYTPSIDIVISDGGVGILQTLRKRQPERYLGRTTREALYDVFCGEVPHPVGKSRGGISRTRNAVKDFGGIFEIRIPFGSGTCFRTDMRFRRVSRFFPGTHVIIKLPTLHNEMLPSDGAKT